MMRNKSKITPQFRADTKKAGMIYFTIMKCLTQINNLNLKLKCIFF